MQITTRQGPAFGVARLGLGPGEHVRAEAGAMMAMSAGVTLEAKMEGGLLRSLKRAALGGESFFVNTYTAPANGGWVDVAARLPGDLTALEIAPGRALFVQKGSWLASASTVELDTQWGGFKNLFGSEGGFILRAAGTGPIVVACYGALETWNLAAGQSITDYVGRTDQTRSADHPSSPRRTIDHRAAIAVDRTARSPVHSPVRFVQNP